MEDSLRKIYEDHASLLHFLTESGMAAPPALAFAASFAINASLRRAIEADTFDPAEIESLLARADADQITLDTQLLSFTAGQRMKRAMVRLEAAAAGEPPQPTAPSPPPSPSPTPSAPCPSRSTSGRPRTSGTTSSAAATTTTGPPSGKHDFKKLGEAMNISVDQLVIEEGVSAF